MNAPSKMLDDNTGNGQRQKREECELRADGQHEPKRAGGEHQSVRRIHDRRPEQHPDRVQVVRGARHDVARAIALVIRIREPLQVREEIVAQVELNIPRDADDHPPRQELKHSLDQRDGDNQQRIGEKLLAGHTGVKIVNGAPQDLRKQDPDSVVQ